MTTPLAAESPQPLWNPNAAALWSLLFTPALGAFLHARNADSLGRTDEAKKNRVWFYISVAYIAFIFVIEFFPSLSYAIPEYVFRGLSIGILLGWYFNAARSQIKYVKDTYQNRYQRKSWAKPLLTAFGSVAVLFLAIFFYFLFSENEVSENSKTSVIFIKVPADQVNIAGSLSEIYIDGEINESILPQIKEIVQKNEIEQAKVLFNSLGGDLGAGTELGVYLREKEFATDVGVINEKWGASFAGECHSACTLAYIGGKYRFFDDASKFGVHRFYSNESTGSFLEAEAETQQYSSLIVAYIRDMGIDISMFNKMAEQSSDDIELLDIDEMRKMNIVNDGALLPVWDHSIDEDGLWLIGSQDTLDESGHVMLTCVGNETLFAFVTDIDMAYKNSSIGHSLILNEDAIDISSNVTEERIDSETGMLFVYFKPDNNQLLKISAADTIGYSYTIKDSIYSFTVDISQTEDKKKMSDFVQYCKS